MKNGLSRSWQVHGAALVCVLAPLLSAAAQTNDPRVDKLAEENRRLQEQVREQQRQIDELNATLAEILKRHEQRDQEIRRLRDDFAGRISEPPPRSSGIDKVILSGEGGVGFFRSGSQGQHPAGEFRVDEAKLFLEAPLLDSVFFFAELDLVTREANDEFFHLGELYVDFEDVSRLWGKDRLLNLRVGRFDIPFGEEYLTRDVINNPLISRSLSDLWGIDEGLALYGSAGKVQYIVAVQNGGHPTLADYTSDKSVAGRLGVDPLPWLHLSASAMRTGELDRADDRDKFSEMWFGNGFFRALGPADRTTRFQANLFELDARGRWRGGHLQLAGGYIDYDDNDVARDNQRDVHYYYAEAVQNVTSKLYGAARFSQILADDGFPIVGNASFGRFLFGPLTKDLWRLSLGLGYRFGPGLILKAEYSFEQGELLNGASRNHQDLLGVEIGMKF